MLAELHVWLMSLSATPPGFRRYLPEAVGLWARGRRQAKAWVPHISQARGLLDTAIDEMHERRSVVVLGSGPLFDIPLESLARTFRDVHLVDRAHLWTIGGRTKRYPNVHLHWRDLSAATAPDALGFVGDIADVDWIISANLLSQMANAASHGREREVIEAHLDALAAQHCRATLITDLDYRVVDTTGKVREEGGLMFGRDLPEPDASWKWEVAPFGEERTDTRRVHRVAAWIDWRAAAGRGAAG
jgi:hypothetical protein